MGSDCISSWSLLIFLLSGMGRLCHGVYPNGYNSRSTYSISIDIYISIDI